MSEYRYSQHPDWNKAGAQVSMRAIEPPSPPLQSPSPPPLQRPPFHQTDSHNTIPACDSRPSTRQTQPEVYQTFSLRATATHLNYNITTIDKTPIYYVEAAVLKPGRPDLIFHEAGGDKAPVVGAAKWNYVWGADEGIQFVLGGEAMGHESMGEERLEKMIDNNDSNEAMRSDVDTTTSTTTIRRYRWTHTGQITTTLSRNPTFTAHQPPSPPRSQTHNTTSSLNSPSPFTHHESHEEIEEHKPFLPPRPQTHTLLWTQHPLLSPLHLSSLTLHNTTTTPPTLLASFTPTPPQPTTQTLLSKLPSKKRGDFHLHSPSLPTSLLLQILISGLSLLEIDKRRLGGVLQKQLPIPLPISNMFAAATAAETKESKEEKRAAKEAKEVEKERKREEKEERRLRRKLRGGSSGGGFNLGASLGMLDFAGI